MRILICFPLMDMETGPGIVYGAIKAGHEVEILDPKVLPKMLFGKVNQLKGKLDLVLCSRTQELRQELRKVKSVYPKIKVAIWNFDSRASIYDWGDELLEMIKEADYYYTIADGRIDQWREIQKNSIWLPQAIQSERYKEEKITPEDAEKYACDILFIGGCNPNYHTYRGKILDTVEEEFGDRFQWRTGLYGSAHSRAIQCSKINLSASGLPEIRNSWSVRVWKIIGVGGIALEHDREGMKEYFKGQVETYKGVDDVVEKINHILDNYEEYKKRARRLMVKCRRKHTYVRRVEDIVRIVEGYKEYEHSF